MNIMQGRVSKVWPTVTVALVTFFAIGAAAQHKGTASAPHPSAPARPQASHPAPSRPSGNAGRPNTAARPNNATRPNNAGVNRPGQNNSRPGANVNHNGNFPNHNGNNRPNGNFNGNSRPGMPGHNGPANGHGNFNARNGNGSFNRPGNRPLPGRNVSLRGGGSASIRPNGQIRSINRNGMQINKGMNGSRRVESVHNGARIVSTGRNSGYVQRNYVTRNGHTYVSRTVVVNHVTYTSVYRSYSYHGYCCYYGYHPAFFYAPVYYGWAYNPWPAPVYYGWGWGGAPWYGYYGPYFAPYPTYPSAAFWLTDYLIAANLQAAYAARAQVAAGGDSGGGGGGVGNGGDSGGGTNDQQQQQQGAGNDTGSSSGQVTLSPEVKQAIADEVKAQLAAEQASANQGSNNQGSSNQGSNGQASDQGSSTQSSNEEVPPALDPARRTFVVANDMTVNVDGQECQLTQGDVITRVSDQPDSDRNVTVSVAASKKSDCGVGKQTAVSLDDLQEMYNHFQEQIDNGMKDLANKQGSNGLPKAPDTKTTPSDVPPPPADNSAAKAVEDQQQAADQAEAQVVKEAFSQGS